MSIRALGLVIGLILIHNGRRIRLAKDLGDWVLGFVDDETGYDYLVLTDYCDQPIRTTIDWLFTEKEAGRLVDPCEAEDHDGRRRLVLGLDRAACAARDPKAAWRFRWASAVLKDGPDTTSDDSYKTWIEERTDLICDDKGTPQAIPAASSLRRWVRKLFAAQGRRGSLVSCAGRLKGKSPLPGLEDFLVTEAALYYWAAEDASFVDSGGYYIDARDRIADGNDEELKKRLASKPVRLETIRARARQLEGGPTTAAKKGDRRARRMFEPAGRGVPTERFLERVEMDGLELRQIVHFSDDWHVAAGKMKMINNIDTATSFWFFPSIFCGPYREDVSAIALMNVMLPPAHIEAAHIEEFPWLQEAYGTCDLIAPDNEMAITSPSSLSALTELGPDVELPDANHPDSKPLVEALNRFIKGFLEGLPGTVRGPRHPKDPTRNALKEAEMTRAQLRAQIYNAWIYWNTVKRPYLGDRSPLEMVQAAIEAGDRPKRNTPGDVRRALFKTHDEIVITRDGFEFDGIIYQSPDLKAVVDANYRHTGFKDRVDGTAKVILSIRTNEGNLHEAEVFDQERMRFVPVASTQPAYTMLLSRWEHAEFKQMSASRTPRRETELDRLRRRADRLRQKAVDLPKLGAKEAARASALLECDESRRALGVRASTPEYTNPTLHGVLATSGRDMRTDVPKPVHVPRPPAGKRASPPSPEFLASLGRTVLDGTGHNDQTHQSQIPADDQQSQNAVTNSGMYWPGKADEEDYQDDLDGIDDFVDEDDDFDDLDGDDEGQVQ